MKNGRFLHFGAAGAAGFAKQFLDAGSGPVFLVCGPRSYAASGAAAVFDPLLSGLVTRRFSAFSPSPRTGELRRALAAFRGSKAGRIIAVGGGSALDLAKLVNYFAAAHAPAAPPKGIRLLPLLAVPTTAGSGSEATGFAVIYRGRRKLSVADARMLPSHVLLAPEFTASQPPYQAACSGFDALAQAIESYWAVGATAASRRDSARAIRLCLRHLEPSVLSPRPACRAGMMRAAYYAGRAINAAKTTAAHALSYSLTARYGLPHGHAVALTLPALLEINAEVSAKDAAGPRGAAHARSVFRGLCRLLGAGGPAAAAARLRRLRARLGLDFTWLSGKRLDPAKVRRLAVREVDRARLENNPRKLNAQALARAVSEIARP